ncbi:hypothetical protein PENSTE_c005G06505 [Penicillium steckii]|uniref:Uncharacterized protein n=1 Tax=Penicillium steckii TaxID=303698 RepID=A0A1V6TIW8_9EURO|nr:hypothetical protein PENSTE_c005G06505 [Penicillium steckii]
MARLQDLPVEIWSMVIHEAFRMQTHKALHSVAEIINGALGPEITAKIRAAYGPQQGQVFLETWARNHSNTHLLAHSRARRLTILGRRREIRAFINANPGAAHMIPQAQLAALQAELVLHDNYLAGVGPYPPNPVQACRPNSIRIPPGPSKPGVLTKIFRRGCRECFNLVFLDNNHPLNIGGYDHTGESYFLMVATSPGIGNFIKEQMLLLMVQNATLDELLTPARVTLFNPDSVVRRNILHVIGLWPRVVNLWIDRLYTLLVVPPPGVLPQALPAGMTPLTITDDCRSSEYLLQAIDWTHYMRAALAGVWLYEVYDADRGLSSWFEILQRPESMHKLQILNHMCTHSFLGISALISLRRPLPATGIEFPDLVIGSKVCPWFMAIWTNQRTYTPMFAASIRIQADVLCTIIGVTPAGAVVKNRLVGFAAIQYMENDDGLVMLLQWLNKARPVLTANRMYENITDLMIDVLDYYADRHLEINERYAAMVGLGPMALVPPGMTIQQAETAEIALIQGHASNMLDALMDRSIEYQGQLNHNSENYTLTLVDTPEFATYLRRIIEPRQRSRLPECRRQRPLLNRILGRGARVTRNRRPGN